MAVFKKTTKLTGKFKELQIVDDKFVDPEFGEVVDLLGVLKDIYGDATFSITTAYSAEEEVEPAGEA